MNTKNKSARTILVVLVGITVVIRTIIYLYVAFKGLGTLAFGNYISIVLNIVMFVSILKYAIEYFIKGNESASLNSLIFKFGTASLATLFGLQSVSKPIFMLTAVMVFLVPYVSANIDPNNKNMDKKKIRSISLLILVILVITIILAVLYIKNPVENRILSMGTLIYNLDAMNSMVQWFLFTVLGFARGIIIMRGEKK